MNVATKHSAERRKNISFRRLQHVLLRPDCFMAVSVSIYRSVQLSTAQRVSLSTVKFSSGQTLRSRRSRRINVTSTFTQDGQERAEQRGGEEVQGEREEGEGREGADAEEEGGAQEGERKEEEGDRGYEGAKKEHGKHVQSDGQSEPELWPTPFCEEVPVTLWSQDLEIGMCSNCENKIELFCC